jgi:hypothetical protein
LLEWLVLPGCENEPLGDVGGEAFDGLIALGLIQAQRLACDRTIVQLTAAGWAEIRHG